MPSAARTSTCLVADERVTTLLQKCRQPLFASDTHMNTLADVVEEAGKPLSLVALHSVISARCPYGDARVRGDSSEGRLSPFLCATFAAKRIWRRRRPTQCLIPVAYKHS